MGDSNFRPPHRINTPWPITKKFGTCDYIGGPYGCAKFGANPSMGGFWANRWNITIFFIYTFFSSTFHNNTKSGRLKKVKSWLSDAWEFLGRIAYERLVATHVAHPVPHRRAEMPFELVWSKGIIIIGWVAHWRHLANTIEWSVRGSDAAFV